ncbi:MAG: ATP-binding protein [Actinomycetes bacterium]
MSWARRTVDPASVALSDGELLAHIGAVHGEFLERPRPEFFERLLDRLLAITNSEYGFLGEVLHDEAGAPFLKTYALTNLAWDDATLALFREQAAKGLEFHNLETLFGRCLVTAEPVIANDAAHDARRAGIPTGHPPLDAFLGMPLHHGGAFIGMLGLANRPEGYDEALLARLEPVFSALAAVVRAHRAEMAKAEAEAELSRMRDELIGTVSHELRTPLAAITGSLALLSEAGTLASDDAELITMAERNAARLRSGAQALEVAPVDVAEVVVAAAEALGPLAAQAGVTVAITAEPAVASVDPQRIEQVVTNLLGNAIDFSPAGARVGVSVRPEADHLVIAVRDEGPGIDPALHEAIFEPFRQADQSMTRTVGGTGLGLAIVRLAVEQHGGSVTVDSSPGQGATFTVRLPRGDGR